MGKYSRSSIRRVLDTVNIVDYINQITSLKKKGKDHLGLCPFHQEKTPSFTVSDPKQFFYCFGCHKHGNIVDFVMQHQQLPFPEAIKLLAEKYQIPLEENKSDDTQDKQRQVITALNQKALAFYQTQLRQTASAQGYLTDRGVSQSAIEAFQIGLAPNEWHALYQHLQPIPPAIVSSCGLFAVKNGRTYDRLRHRIVFPIRDLTGRCIGFGGRVIQAADQPKYLNSPDTLLFNKSHTLYGLYECLQKRSTQRLIVVEGYMDVVMLHQHGITSAVASLGTAFTAGHLKLCQRYAEKQIIFCFDGDQAGQRAMSAAIELLLPHINDKQKFNFLTMPPSQDPDSFIQDYGTEAFEQALSQAPSLDKALKKRWSHELDMSDLQDKATYLKRAQADMKKCPASFFKTLILDELAKEFPIKTAVPPTPTQTPTQKKSMNDWIECLACLLNAPDLIEGFTKGLQPILHMTPVSLASCLKYLQSFSTHKSIPQLLEDTRSEPELNVWLHQALAFKEPAHPEIFTENYMLFLKKRMLDKRICELMDKDSRTPDEQHQLSELIKIKHQIKKNTSF